MNLNYFKSKGFLFLWAFAVTLNIIAFFLIFSKGGLNGPNVALRYTVKAGVLWYGQGTNLYFLPALGVIFNLTNFFLFRKLGKNEPFLSGMAAFANALVQLIILTALIFLAGIN